MTVDSLYIHDKELNDKLVSINAKLVTLNSLMNSIDGKLPITLEVAFGAGGEISSSNGTTNFVVGDGTSKFTLFGLSNVCYLKANKILHIELENQSSYDLIIDYDSNKKIEIFVEGATTTGARGAIGVDNTTIRPFQYIYADQIFDNDGNLGSYAAVDDLQLIRNIIEKDGFIDPKTLPWRAAVSDISTEFLNYNFGSKLGFILCAMKAMVDKIDLLEAEINLLKST